LVSAPHSLPQKVDFLRKRIQQQRFTLINDKNADIQFPKYAPIIHSYPLQIFTIFQNLISNGIKFNENCAPKILVDYKEQKLFHHFSVTDNGIGLEEEYKEQVFEMFIRLHDRQAYKGSGLGLAICKKIICRIGGEIWLEKMRLREQGFVLLSLNTILAVIMSASLNQICNSFF